MTQLVVLSLHGNLVSTIERLDHCKDLQELNLSGNQIQSIQGLDNIPQLQQLYLSGNKIQSIQGLDNMPQLQQLYLSGNKIQSIQGLQSLQELATLDLRDNKLVMDSVATHDQSSLQTLAINGQIRDLPTELLSPKKTYDTTDEANCLPALRAWYAALVAESPATNRLFKVVVCGNGMVGKTTLINRLLQLGLNAEDIRSTHGIQIVQSKPLKLMREAPDKVQLRVWDFGGQEVYHQTHRLFLSYRAIYLVVFDAATYEANTQQDPNTQESEASRSLAFWLSEIKSRDNDSPVIVVQNKVDIANDEIIPFQKHIPQDLLPDAKVEVSAENGRNFANLREALQRQIRQSKEYVMPIPASWEQARTATLRLVAKAQRDKTGKKAKIKKATYLAKIVVPAGITEESHQQAVLQYFHATGIFFYEPEYLEDDIILNQQWALDAIYAILERNPTAGSAVAQFSQRCRDMRGRFRPYDLPFPKDRYTADDRKLFLGFMESARICFKLQTGQDNEDPIYQLVRALSLAPSDFTRELWEDKEKQAVHFRYHHRYHLHAGIIESFIIAMAGHCKLYQLWRTGALVIWDKNWAWINVNYYAKEITISVAGAQREHLLSAIRNAFRDIHQGNSTIDKHCSVDGQQWVALEKLKEAIDSRAELARTLTGEYIPYEELKWALRHDAEANFEKRPKVIHEVAVAEDLPVAPSPTPSEVIREHLADGHVDKALAVLREAYPKVGIALQGEFKRIKRSFSMGVMSDQEHRQESRTMTLRILSLVEDLQASGSEADYTSIATAAQQDLSAQMDRIEAQIGQIDQTTQDTQRRVQQLQEDIPRILRQLENGAFSEASLAPFITFLQPHLQQLQFLAEDVATRKKAYEALQTELPLAQKMKLIIPLIPGILKYETELTGNPKDLLIDAWNDLKAGREEGLRRLFVR
ncbi:MAG: leucine-rich repeat protein [Bacteroidota bacterium]